MTRPAIDKRDEPFSDWIRNHPSLDSVRESLSVQNADLIIHRFSARQESRRTTIAKIFEHIQILEVKAFDADQPFAQRDTWQVFDAIARKIRAGKRCGIKIADRRRPGCKRTVRWLGVHLLQMSGDRPDRSDRMIWDGKYQIDEQTLVELIRFDRDPDHPLRLLDLRRHHALSHIEIDRNLFDSPQTQSKGNGK